MSKLEELIEKLCPDGVKYKTLGELHSDKKCIMRGIRITKKDLIENGQYKVYGGGEDIIFGYYDKYNIKKDTVTINVAGSVGFVDYITEDSWIVDSRYAFFTSEMNRKFLYYALKNKENELRSFVKGAIPGINMDLLMKVRVPIPPMEVQSEIVRILDNFTELTSELTSELTARKKQYEYYREKLFIFDNNQKVRWMTIGEICTKVSSGGTPSTAKREYYSGNIPWLRTQEVDFCEIYDTEVKITEEAVNNSSAKLIQENCVIVAMYGATAGKVAINKIPLTTNQACCNLQIDSNVAMYRFVFYWLSSQYLKLKALGQGSQSNINSKIVKDYPIPVPSIEEQKRIVDILDRFDLLSNDILVGIPAEIEARKKQYEYYRDKLLTFKELEV